MYNHPDHTYKFSAEKLSKANREVQVNVMRTWFLERYEDPQNECPYDSEDGYFYPWGGPYDASEVLQDEFSNFVPEDVIDALAKALEDETGVCNWSAIGTEENVDEYFVDAVSSTENPHDNLFGTLDSLSQLSAINLDYQLNQKMLEMIFVNIITALEAYLSEFFVREVLSNAEKLNRFIETNPDFKKIKYTLAQVSSSPDFVKLKVREYLANLLWHKLEKVKPMFRSALDIEFPKSIDYMMTSIQMRHDLVHRSGKKKNGDQITIERAQVERLIDEVRSFVAHIEKVAVSKYSF